jgi:hypothetical protein
MTNMLSILIKNIHKWRNMVDDKGLDIPKCKMLWMTKSDDHRHSDDNTSHDLFGKVG